MTRWEAALAETFPLPENWRWSVTAERGPRIVSVLDRVGGDNPGEDEDTLRERAAGVYERHYWLGNDVERFAKARCVERSLLGATLNRMVGLAPQDAAALSLWPDPRITVQALVNRVDLPEGWAWDVGVDARLRCRNPGRRLSYVLGRASGALNPGEVLMTLLGMSDGSRAVEARASAAAFDHFRGTADSPALLMAWDVACSVTPESGGLAAIERVARALAREYERGSVAPFSATRAAQIVTRGAMAVHSHPLSLELVSREQFPADVAWSVGSPDEGRPTLGDILGAVALSDNREFDGLRGTFRERYDCVKDDSGTTTSALEACLEESCRSGGATTNWSSAHTD